MVVGVKWTHNGIKGGIFMAMQKFSDDQSNLNITIHQELRRRIILEAARSNLTVQTYVEQILEQNVPSESPYLQDQKRGLNKAAVEDLLRFQEQIKRSHLGQVFEDSAEALRQIREDRMRELEQR
jgi:predicted metal-dependent RNase